MTEQMTNNFRKVWKITDRFGIYLEKDSYYTCFYIPRINFFVHRKGYFDNSLIELCYALRLRWLKYQLDFYYGP